jgi:hypothetical protein
MVRSTIAVLDPIINMQVLDFCSRLELGTNECVVELLRVHVKDIGVTLDGWDSRGLVNIFEVCAERIKDCVSLSVFVKVTGSDDGRVSVDRQNRANKVLEEVKNFVNIEEESDAYCKQFDLGNTLVDDTVYRWAGITVDRTRATFGRHVYVDSKYLLARSHTLEECDERLASGIPGSISRIDTSRIETT